MPASEDDSYTDVAVYLPQGATSLTVSHRPPTGCFNTSTRRGSKYKVLDTGVTAVRSGQRF